MKAFSQFTEESLYEDMGQALLQMSSYTCFTAHDGSNGIALFSWRKGGERYCLEAVWQDGGPHLTLFQGVNDVDGIIASMGDEWPEGAEPAFEVFCAAVERTE